MRTKAFSTVNWRKYIDVNVNPRAKAFLDSRGDDVLWQMANNVHKAAVNKGLSQLVLLVHPNAGAVIKIEKQDFKEVLTLALKWFEKRENYKRCSRIQLFIDNLDKLRNGIKVDKNINKLVI